MAIGAAGVRGGERVGHGRREQVEQQARLDAEDDDQRASGASVRISTGVMSVRWSPRLAKNVRQLAEDDPAEHVQQVAGRQDHDERRDRGRGRAHLERPDQRQELPDEPGQAGQAAEANTKKPNTAT